MNKQYLALACMGLCLTGLPAVGADYYQCRDAEGTMSFSDRPCPAEAETLRERASRPAEPAAPATPGSAPSDAADGVPATAEPAAAQSAEDLEGERLLLTAELRQAIAALRPLRQGMTEFFAARGRWPADLESVGVNPLAVGGSRFTRIELGAEGVIIAHLAPRLGDNRRIELDPIPAMGGHGFEWRCIANYPPEVLHDGLQRFCDSGPVAGAGLD
ncbi:MAG TPA: DUF4124 domain-containing protein [Thioalkalivibrio sp.]|nr:DUF4124 domain-containing protein [Thioalkalivibrio sp.]